MRSISLSSYLLIYFHSMWNKGLLGSLTAWTSTLPPRRMAIPSLSVFMTISEGWPRAADTCSSTISATPRLASRAWWNKSFCFSNSCSCRQGGSDSSAWVSCLYLSYFYLLPLEDNNICHILPQKSDWKRAIDVCSWVIYIVLHSNDYSIDKITGFTFHKE